MNTSVGKLEVIKDAFEPNSQSIDGIYVDGISISLGSPRKHVWTYAAGPGELFNI